MTGDELKELFATVIYARRAEAGLEQDEVRRVWRWMLYGRQRTARTRLEAAGKTRWLAGSGATRRVGT